MLLTLQQPLAPAKLRPRNEEAVAVFLLKATVLDPRRNPMVCDRSHINILYAYSLGRVFLKHEPPKEVCAEDALPSCSAAGEQAVETI